MTLFDFSGGMESAAMVYLCRDEIKANHFIVRWADTGADNRQRPRMQEKRTAKKAMRYLVKTSIGILIEAG